MDKSKVPRFLAHPVECMPILSHIFVRICVYMLLLLMTDFCVTGKIGIIL